ncbi:MAG TPA: hypothetical protein EYG46_15125 [Myxococcales bacterium]|nr:hypothetical protein [Myxococcales bacterium]HIM02312.1 hypothetical protein [Myxococcales bacterium]
MNRTYHEANATSRHRVTSRYAAAGAERTAGVFAGAWGAVVVVASLTRTAAVRVGSIDRSGWAASCGAATAAVQRW